MGRDIVFLHPDLGIGGAERLVVDAAVALLQKGFNVSFVTTHHDKTHCFDETKDGRFSVNVVGDWIPRSILGRFYALCAYIRMIYAALYVVFFSDLNPDVIICDIVSACIPVLRLRRKSYIIFYCHFPDQLLSVPGSKMKALYRAPLNWVEERTTGMADVILVNSEFTRSVFKKTFRSINKLPEILYPSINTKFFDNPSSLTLEDILGLNIGSENFTFLSINRYERKKNIALAIEALKELQKLLGENEWEKVYLIVAGGFDDRVQENLEHFEELKEKAKQLDLKEKVIFLKSPSDLAKLVLLKFCNCLLYTPHNEHFGIVPLEAMYSQKAVIAVNSGGPTETVANGVTGFLCKPDIKEFSAAMAKCVTTPNLVQSMGEAGQKRFNEKFSFSAFQEHLNTIVGDIISVNKETNKKSI